MYQNACGYRNGDLVTVGDVRFNYHATGMSLTYDCDKFGLSEQRERWVPGTIKVWLKTYLDVISASVQQGILYVSCPQPYAPPYGYLLFRVHADGLVQTFYNTPGLEHPLAAPGVRRVPRHGVMKELELEPKPEDLRWDPGYRWGRVAARNFSWRFGAPATSTGVR